MVLEKTDIAVAEIMKKISEVSPEIWASAIKQQYINAYVCVITAFVLALIISFLFIYLLRIKDDDIVVIIFIFFAGLIILEIFLIYEAISGFVNPEWGAFKSLVRTLKLK